ncbi:MAG TPA: serine hydrolase domain-containing protein [Gemmatimonadales bacterium]|nr:serine hydrolase domain-containing protein [Gemmatimonadales bacterium]
MKGWALRGTVALALAGLGAPPASSAMAPLAPASSAPPTFAQVDAAVRRGITRGVYPGAVVVVGRSDRILYAAAYGRTTWSRRAPHPTVRGSLWDVASLTKVVGTASAAARLVDRDSLELDAPVARYLPRFGGEVGGDKGRVTVRMLLDHTSGLPPFLPLYRMAKSRDAALDLVYAEPLRRTPGDSALYSDLNAILLGLVLEQVTALPLDTIVAREVTRPLGMRDTRFRLPARLAARAVPSGIFHGRELRGEVNDLNAAAMGGVAGHAGLFSTGADLARFAQTWLRLGRPPRSKRQWVDSTTLRRFLTGSPGSGARLLGWDTRDTTRTEPSVFGSLLSAEAYGHTGWTGTELWIDPARDLFLVFLTNRSFDPRTKQNSFEELRDVRAAVSDAAVRAADRLCAASRAQAKRPKAKRPKAKPSTGAPPRC